jgi:hypothetical protein
VSGVSLPPVHGQGVGLLAAPVTLLTSSLTAVRVWMSVLSAAGLLGAVACWRGLRPWWVLAVAELVLGGLAISQNSGVQVYPDWWGALGVLALTGLFLQAVGGSVRGRVVLPLIAVASLVITLMRPQNVVFVMGPVIVASVVVARWRQPRVWAAMGAGVVLGFAEWLAGAFLWFGGLGGRVRLAGQEPPALRLYFALGTQLRSLNGGWYCTPPGCGGWAVPWETPWWVAFAVVAGLGVWAGWRAGGVMRSSAVLAGFTAVWVLVLYAFLVPFGAPRYLLPVFALMAVLAADGVAWAVTARWRWRRLAVAAACVFVVGGLVSQRLVLQRQASDQTLSRNFQEQAGELQALGVKPPCVMLNTSIAWYAGCSAPWTTIGSDNQIMARFLQVHGLQGWKELQLPARLQPPPGGQPMMVYLPAGNPLIRAQDPAAAPPASS